MGEKQTYLYSIPGVTKSFHGNLSMIYEGGEIIRKKF